MEILRPRHVRTQQVKVGSTVWLEGGFEYIGDKRVDYKAPATVVKITPKGWLNVVPNHDKTGSLQFRPMAGTYYRGPTWDHRDIWISEPEDDESLLVANFDAYRKRLADAEAEQLRQYAAELAANEAAAELESKRSMTTNANAEVFSVEQSPDLWYLQCRDRQNILHQVFFGLRHTANYYDFGTNTVHASGYFIEATSYNTSIYHPELREWHKFSGSNFVPAGNFAMALAKAREWLIQAVW